MQQWRTMEPCGTEEYALHRTLINTQDLLDDTFIVGFDLHMEFLRSRRKIQNFNRLVEMY